MILHKLPDDQLRDCAGVIAHYHIQTNKVDPGPALDWDYVIGHARRLMDENDTSLGHMRKRF